MKNFFRALERHRVRYLLISGQACVLYGAAPFTEDVDLWVAPTPSNFRSFLRALASVHATVYKLTPPFSVAFAKKRHGFHFRIGADGFVDVMGYPPRVGGFRDAARRARKMRTDWGVLPVVAPVDLVKLKRTNRPADYEAITKLVRRCVQEGPENSAMIRWAVQNTFDVEDLATFVATMARPPHRPAARALLPLPVSAKRMRRANELLAKEMGMLQDKGRAYWKPVVQDLKRLQRQGRLVPEGTPVRTLVR